MKAINKHWTFGCVAPSIAAMNLVTIPVFILLFLIIGTGFVLLHKVLVRRKVYRSFLYGKLYKRFGKRAELLPI